MNKNIEVIIHRRHGGYYYGLDQKGKEYTCSLRGVLKKNTSTTSLVVVGDRVRLEIQDDGSCIIEEIFERKSVLQRAKGFRHKEDGKPSRSGQVLISNLDQVLIVIPVKEPDFHPLLLDRFLALVEHMELTPVILFHKWDLLKDDSQFLETQEIYDQTGFESLGLSLKSGRNLDKFHALIRGKTSFLMGPSGAGKSSLVRSLDSELEVRIGEWTEKCKGGQQTTTATRLYPMSDQTFIADTAGFSQVFLSHIPRRHLRYCYPEFEEISACKYHDCIHAEEDHCQVKAGVRSGQLNDGRYARYIKLLEECDEKG
jgi:ribosome biogenesis GTPase / thiamine phosphate phosphatase